MDGLEHLHAINCIPTIPEGGTNFLHDSVTDLNAINCMPCIPEGVADYVRESLSENTRRAYFSDLAHFEAWGGSVPASAEMVASYLADHADTLTVATLVRRVASISKAHAARGFSLLRAPHMRDDVLVTFR